MKGGGGGEDVYKKKKMSGYILLFSLERVIRQLRVCVGKSFRCNEKLL